MELKKIWKQIGFSKQVTGYEEVPSTLSKASGDKRESLEGLYVPVNGVEYDAHTEAINNMTAVLAVANQKAIQAMCQALDIKVVYDAVYKTTTTWKGYDNKTHTIQIESLSEAIEKAMTERGKIYGAL